MNRPVPRADIERFTASLAEKRRRLAKVEHQTRGYRDEEGMWQGGLLSFVKYFWHVLEPGTPFTEGWVLEAICLPSETQITTTEGQKSIGDIVESGWRGSVLSFNHDTLMPEWKPVAARMKSPGKPLLVVKAGESTLRLTDNHPVFTLERGYVRADEIKDRDVICLRSVPNGIRTTPEPKSVLQQEVLRRRPIRQGEVGSHSCLQILWEGILSLSFSSDRWVLFSRMSWPIKNNSRKGHMSKMWELQIMGRRWVPQMLRPVQAHGADVSMHTMREGNLSVPRAVRSGIKKVWSFLQPKMRWPFQQGARKYWVCGWEAGSEVSSGVCNCAPSGKEARKKHVLPLLQTSMEIQKGRIGYPSYRPESTEQRVVELSSVVQGLPPLSTRSRDSWDDAGGYHEAIWATVHSVERDLRIPATVYNIEVADNNNYFAENILVHNCEHLEAVTFGEVTNLLINVPPGFCKSLLTNVFFPAFEWGPMNMSHLRYVTFSYSSSNTERDNQRFGDLISSVEFQALYPHVKVRQRGMTMVSNQEHGWKLASSVGGSVTGKRGNRAINDDLNNVSEAESKPVLDQTNRWFRESLSSRLNNIETDAKIVIAQRVGEGDVSGEIMRLGLNYCHLMVQMEFEWDASTNQENGEPYTTDIGWSDPRWRPNKEDCEGELAWPERFPENAVRDLKVVLGPYATASQLQQTPEPRGGGLIKREWWMPAEVYMIGRKFPPLEYVVASLDGAYTEEEKNDPSALTIWGIFQNEHGNNRAMLIHAWSKRLEFTGPKIDILPNEHESAYKLRARPFWGLIEWVGDSCNRFKVDKLLIESKASGISAAQSLRNSHGRQGWDIQLVEPKGDKMARGLAIVPSFSQEMIYAPDPEEFGYSGKVIDECAVFPYGSHDDLYDTVTQAIKHLRDTGLIRSDEERRAQEADAVRHRGAPKPPLYPGMRQRRA